MKILRNVKKVTKNLIVESSTHGISHLIRAKYFILKLMWLILIMGSAACAIYFVNERVLDYLEYKVTTEVRLEDSVSLDFPTITICNKNKLSTQYAIDQLKAFLENNIKNNAEVNQNSSGQMNDLFNNITKKSQVEFYKAVTLFKIYPAFLLRDMFHFDELKNVTLSLNEMLLGCKFDGVDCTENDFEWVFNEKYGNCYRFNWNFKKDKKHLKKTERPSKDYGLILNLYVGLPKEMNKVPGIDRGVYVSIDSYTTNPFANLNDVIDAQTSLETTVVIHRSEFKKYPKPYSNCDLTDSENESSFFGSSYKKLIEDSGYSYSQNICLEFCRNYLINSICNCTQLLSSIQIPNINVCNETNKVAIQCYEENKNITLLNERCFRKTMCPLECEKIKYDYSLTLSMYPSFLADFFKKNIADSKSLDKNEYEKFRPEKDLLRLQIFYGSMSYLKYKESPSMSVFALISSIGGTLGLFMGMSVLSFAEFFEIILQVLITLKGELSEKRRHQMAKHDKTRMNEDEEKSTGNHISSLAKEDIQNNLSKKITHFQYEDILAKLYSNFKRKWQHQNLSAQNFDEIVQWSEENSAIPNDFDQPFCSKIDYQREMHMFHYLRLFLTTKRLIRFAILNDILIVINSTNKKNLHGYSLLVLGTVDTNKNHHPIGLFFTKYELSNDFTYCFQCIKELAREIYSENFFPKILVADNLKSASNGYLNTFFTRPEIGIVCWAHFIRHFDSMSDQIIDASKRRLIRYDLIKIQQIFIRNAFEFAKKLLIKKWSNDCKIHKFLVNLLEEWTSEWYEELDSDEDLLDIKAKRSDLLKLERNGAQQLIGELKSGFLRDWSSKREVKIREDNFTLISQKEWQQAYNWSLSKKRVISLELNCDETILFVPKGTRAEFTDEESSSYFNFLQRIDLIKNEEDTFSFDEFIRRVQEMNHIIFDNEEWRLSVCSCPWWRKNNICRHLIAIAETNGLVCYPENVSLLSRERLSKKN